MNMMAVFTSLHLNSKPPELHAEGLVEFAEFCSLEDLSNTIYHLQELWRSSKANMY